MKSFYQITCTYMHNIIISEVLNTGLRFADDIDGLAEESHIAKSP